MALLPHVVMACQNCIRTHKIWTKSYRCNLLCSCHRSIWFGRDIGDLLPHRTWSHLRSWRSLVLLLLHINKTESSIFRSTEYPEFYTNRKKDQSMESEGYDKNKWFCENPNCFYQTDKTGWRHFLLLGLISRYSAHRSLAHQNLDECTWKIV